MKLYVKFNLSITRKALLEELFQKLGLEHQITGQGEVALPRELTEAERGQLEEAFKKYGIEILDLQTETLVERIRDAVSEMIREEQASLYKISDHLSEKLGYSYSYLSNLFSETTHCSIENFVILKRVDMVKELLSGSGLTLTEIAHRLHYSSVAHLSSQFKKTTGLTPSAFQRIVEKRNASSDSYAL